MTRDRQGAWVLRVALVLCILAVVMAGYAGRRRWMKVMRVTVPKEGFVFEEQFFAEYPDEPEGWPK